MAPGSGWVGAFSWVFVARIVSSAVTFLTVALVGRVLGRGLYGELVILLAIMKVAAELVGPALDTTLVRFTARFREKSSFEAQSYYQAVFRAKLSLAVVLLLLGLVLAWPLAHAFSSPGAGDIVPLAIVIAFVGAACTVLWGFAQACFQAQQRFGHYASLELASALIRLILVIILLACGFGQVLPILAAYAAAPAFAAVLAWRQLPSDMFGRPRSLGSVWSEVLHFAKWVLVACSFTSLAQRVDVFLLAAWRSSSEAIGDYGAALQLTLLGDLVILTLFNVLLPKAAALKNADELRHFLREFRWPTMIVFSAVVPLLFASRSIARLTFGVEFVNAGGLFAILLLGAVFALGCAPAGATLYGMGRTRSIAVLEGLKLVGMLVAGSFAVRFFGVYGMAWTVAAVKGTMGIATYVLAARSISVSSE